MVYNKNLSLNGLTTHISLVSVQRFVFDKLPLLLLLRSTGCLEIMDLRVLAHSNARARLN